MVESGGAAAEDATRRLTRLHRLGDSISGLFTASSCQYETVERDKRLYGLVLSRGFSA